MRKSVVIGEFLEKSLHQREEAIGLFFIYEIYILLHISYLKCKLMTIKRKSKGEKLWI